MTTHPLPPLPLIENAIFIDNSMLELFTTCPRALEYNKLHKRISAGEAPALNFGSAIHLALELRYKIFGSKNTPDIKFNTDVADLLGEFFQQHPVPMDEPRNYNWALEILNRYNQKYAIEEFDLLTYKNPIPCIHCEGSGKMQFRSEIEQDIWRECFFCQGSGMNKYMVELPFTVDLHEWVDWLPLSALPAKFPEQHILEEKITEYGTVVKVRIRVIYTGRIDLPNYKKEHIYIDDHKTTSMLGSGFFDAAKMSAQQKGYCWAFQKVTGLPVRGYEINAVRTKEAPKWVTDQGEPRPKSKVRTPEAWWDESLARERYIINEGELEEWEFNCIALVKEFFWHYQQGYFPKKTSWCVGKFGRCPYYEVCSTFPVADRGILLNSGMFQPNEWSPLLSPSQSKQQ